MKRVVLFLVLTYVSVAVKTTLENDGLFGDDLAERIADTLSMSETDVQMCFNKTGVTYSDLMKFDEIMDDTIQSVDFDSSALRAGCFLTCLCQVKGVMSGSHIKVDKLREFWSSKAKSNHAYTVIFYKIMDTCTDRVRSKTNECEVSLKFVMCVSTEMRRYVGV